MPGGGPQPPHRLPIHAALACRSWEGIDAGGLARLGGGPGLASGNAGKTGLPLVRLRPCVLQDQMTPAKDPCCRLPTATPTACTVRACTCGCCVREMGELRVYAWVPCSTVFPGGTLP
jgi:hypothetical protein